MPQRPIVLVHGYSDSDRGFDTWRRILESWELPATSIYVGSYVSLANEVTIKDVAEGFDRALLREAGLSADSEFDAIVHSTGMLVIRAWLNNYTKGDVRRARLKHLIALAPATNGSPLAHQGRSWMGALFKGNKEFGPDFMEAGDEILYALELGSRFTWDLAHEDMLGDNARFRPGPETPFVFTFCGNKNYGFLENLATEEEGSDGTVRWAGCALNSRKIVMNLLTNPGENREPAGTVLPWANQEHPLIFIDGANHGTIMSDPPALLQELVQDALSVETAEEFSYWNRQAKECTEPAQAQVARWQQFIIRMLDERGDPVPDWNLKLFGSTDAKHSLRQFDMDVHVYKRDPSLRCFHVNLDKLNPETLEELYLCLIASSGTNLVAYHGTGSERVDQNNTGLDPNGKYDAKFDLTNYLRTNGFTLFCPYTTTFIEIRINREPMPLVGRNNVYWFASHL